MHDFVTLTIADVRRCTPGAIEVVFKLPDAARAVFAFRPGQHVNLRADIDGVEVRRSYSICSDPADVDLRIAIKRVHDGQFSNWAHAHLVPGQTIDVSPPAGRFALKPGDGEPRRLLAIAAGSGITPIISIVRHALRTEPLTRVALIYGNRTVEEILFRDELEDLKDRYLDRFTLINVLSRGDMTETPLLEGRIDGAKLKALAAGLAVNELAHVYLCGPGNLIKEARNTLFGLGVARERVHHEFFAAGGGAYRTEAATTAAAGTSEPQVAPQPPPQSAQQAPDGTEAVITLDGLVHRFKMRPGETVIEAALRAGIRVPYACRGGMCCTCRAQVLEGEAVMKINYSLEPWETGKGFVLTCQAVATSPRLVLDYDQM